MKFVPWSAKIFSGMPTQEKSLISSSTTVSVVMSFKAIAFGYLVA